MQVRVAREFKGEPACLIFVEGRYARIFLDQTLQAAIFGVDAEGDRVAFEDASCARQQAKHGLATIKRRKSTKKDFCVTCGHSLNSAASAVDQAFICSETGANCSRCRVSPLTERHLSFGYPP